MKSTDPGALLQDWLDNVEPELLLSIDGGDVALQRVDGGVLCKAALDIGWKGQPGLLEKALRLSLPSLGQFRERTAALSLDPADGRFWLLLRAGIGAEDSLEACIEACLEALITQRDVWNELLQREAGGRKTAAAQPLYPWSLRQRGAYA
ncbi:type III secretion system chaperone [Pseudomonas indica]|uniref:type III secretion system chaperone n=1 Tax=Pseudomonas indica TaxID=137658 RepID=UPI003FCF0653